MALREASGDPTLGRILSFNPYDANGGLLSVVKAKEYDIFDLSASWQITDGVAIRAGVDNVLDASPIRVGGTRGFPYDPSKTFEQNEAARLAACEPFGGPPAGGTGPLGCRTPAASGYSLPAHANVAGTAGGYYDTLGRRYFVGLELTF